MNEPPHMKNDSPQRLAATDLKFQQAEATPEGAA